MNGMGTAAPTTTKRVVRTLAHHHPRMAAGRKAVPGWRAAPAVRHRVDLVAPYPDRRAVARAVVMKDQGSLEALAEARVVGWVEPCPVQTAVPLVATAAWAVVVTEVGGLVEGLVALAAV